MSSYSRASIWWVRRDFRLSDNPALGAAVDAGDAVLPLFVLDPAILRRAGETRTEYLMAALTALDARLRDAGGAGLSVVTGKPAEVVPRVAAEVGASEVHISADYAPYGRRRDAAVAEALAGTEARLVTIGSPYGVSPGTLKTASTGTPFQVFTPFWRAWQDRGLHSPAPAVDPTTVTWIEASGRTTPTPVDDAQIAEASEEAALRAWRTWLEDDSAEYKNLHDFPGPDGTSRLSVPLKWGFVHPRTVIADLAPKNTVGAAAVARQVVWRDFFADVLFHKPEAVSQPIRAEFARMPMDDPDTDPMVAERLKAWQEGRTGFPLVDAGMRQLLAEGWMHNRVRMVVASFLIKDLHIGWWHGADWFMEKLRDGDISQNQLNWQWVAGCGTDAAPYYRVFNPTGQATKFDADGTYIRRWVPELRGVEDRYVHEPWASSDDMPEGYPAPMVDHAEERKEALARLASLQEPEDKERDLKGS
jgi:deoxyribodipyrimidine photo-lyase